MGNVESDQTCISETNTRYAIDVMAYVRSLTVAAPMLGWLSPEVIVLTTLHETWYAGTEGDKMYGEP